MCLSCGGPIPAATEQHAQQAHTGEMKVRINLYMGALQAPRHRFYSLQQADTKRATSSSVAHQHTHVHIGFAMCVCVCTGAYVKVARENRKRNHTAGKETHAPMEWNLAKTADSVGGCD